MERLGSGTYEKLRITSTAIEPHNEGEPKIVIQLVDTNGGDMGVRDYLYTSNKAWDKMTVKRLKAYGFDAATTPLFDLNGENPLIGSLVGPVVVEEEEYNGKTYSKVARVGEFVSEQLAPEAVKELETALSARLGIKKQGARRPRPATPVTEAPEQAATGTDDSVPF